MAIMELVLAAAQVGASLYSGASGAKAAANAGRIQQGAANQAAYETRQATEEATGNLEPYIGAGTAADSYIYALMGLPDGGRGGAGGFGGGGGSGRSREAVLEKWANDQQAANPAGLAPTRARYEAMGLKNSQLYPTYESWLDQTLRNNGVDPDAIVSDYETQARGEAQSQQAPTGAGGAGATYDQAMAAYDNSPWARFAREGAETARKNANESFLSTAGARGGLVSGATAAGLYDIAQEAEDERFRAGFTQGYFPNLTRISDRGYNAVGGANTILIGGADDAAGYTVAGADARADAGLAAHESRVAGINGALYAAGRLYDAASSRGAPTGSTVGKAPRTTPAPTKTAPPKIGAPKFTGG